MGGASQQKRDAICVAIRSEPELLEQFEPKPTQIKAVRLIFASNMEKAP
jgi:hypothetical protein